MSTTSPNKGYTVPSVGGDNNAWGTGLNTTLGLIDQNLGGNASINVAGNSNVTLTGSQSANLEMTFTGALTGNINVILPAGLGGEWIVQNSTSGAYSLTLITAAGGSTGVAIPQGTTIGVWSNGTNVAASQSALIPANNLSDLANAATSRSNLGLGTAATQATSAFCQTANNLSDVNAASARTNLGLGTAATKNTGTSGATVPLLNGANTWSGTDVPLSQALTSGSAADFTTGQKWVATVNGGTFTITNPSAATTDAIYEIRISYTTSNTVSWGTNFKGISSVSWTATAGAVDIALFQYNGSTFELVGYSLNAGA